MAMYNMYFLKSDYNVANTSADRSLSELKANLNNVASKLSYYAMGASRVLEGQAYTIILNRLKTYGKAYNFLSEAIDVALNNMTAGNNSVINAMGNFSELSGKKMQEIENELSRQRSLYNSLNNTIQNGDDTKDKAELNTINNNRYAQIKQLESQKTELEEALINTNSADAEGASNLSSIGNTFVNFEKCFTEK